MPSDKRRLARLNSGRRAGSSGTLSRGSPHSASANSLVHLPDNVHAKDILINMQRSSSRSTVLQVSRVKQCCAGDLLPTQPFRRRASSNSNAPPVNAALAPQLHHRPLMPPLAPTSRQMLSSLRTRTSCLESAPLSLLPARMPRPPTMQGDCSHKTTSMHTQSLTLCFGFSPHLYSPETLTTPAQVVRKYSSGRGVTFASHHEATAPHARKVTASTPVARNAQGLIKFSFDADRGLQRSRVSAADASGRVFCRARLPVANGCVP